MSAKCKDGKADVRISIVSATELRVRDVCNDTWAQKYVTTEGGPTETHFTFNELKDLGAMLHDAPEFKSDKDPTRAQLIIDLGYVLIKDDADMKREELVQAMQKLMANWLELCKQDSTCILPMTLNGLQDPNQIKIASLIDNLKQALVNAKSKSLPSGITDLPPDTLALIDALAAAKSKREQ